MRILLLGDASNCHNALAAGLRALGQQVTVASDGGGWMHTGRDLDISRGRLPGPLGGAQLYWRLRHGEASRALRGYDVVALSNPVFLPLRPPRVREVLDGLRRHNGAVFLTAMGTDTPYVEECLDPRGALRYNEYRLPGGALAPHAALHPGEERAWTGEPLRSHCRYVYDNVRGAVAVLWEYVQSCRRWLPADRVGYGGIPVDTLAIKPVEIPSSPAPVRLMLPRHSYRRELKGTDRLWEAMREAASRHPGRAECILVEDRPYGEFLGLMREAHVVADQAYSYTPATTALLAMAHGIPTVSGGEPEYYDFIGERENRPVYNAPITQDEMVRLFERIISEPEGALARRGRASRLFVEKHNDALVVARRFLDFWTSKM